MEIHTQRLVLRPWRESDAAPLYDMARDPRVGPAAGWPVHTGVENSREVIRNVLAKPENYAVTLRADDTLVGCIGLMIGAQSTKTRGETEAEIGYWMGVNYWGKGYMPEAVRALTQRAFTQLGITQLWCGYYDGNEKSHRVQEKCGFLHSYTQENEEVPLLGERRTLHVSGLDRARWQAQGADACATSKPR